MKWVFVFLLSSFLNCSLLATYNGNPSQPEMPEIGLWSPNDLWWGFKLGYEWDNTFEKSIEVQDKKLNKTFKMDGYNSVKNIGILTFNGIDRFEIYGMMGTLNLKMTEMIMNNIFMEYQTSTSFMWGVGGRIILVYWKEMIMGVNALFSKSHLNMNYVLENGRKCSLNEKLNWLNYNEWQLGVTFSKEIGFMVPYIGLAYSSMNSTLSTNFPTTSRHIIDSEVVLPSNSVKKENIKNKEPFVFLLGIGIVEEEFVTLNIESRLLGEKGISIFSNIKF